MFLITLSEDFMPVELYEAELAELIDPASEVERLATGFRFVEGPVLGDRARNCLYFSDIPANTIYRWSPDADVSIYRKPSHFLNGLTMDAQAGDRARAPRPAGDP